MEADNNLIDWKDRAASLLKQSLYPIPSEINELDWKSDLSSKSERLAEHISAFANLPGGGFLVFGVSDSGKFEKLTTDKVNDIIKTLGNIASNNLSQAISVENAVIEVLNYPLLFIYIPEQQHKPISIRGKDIYKSFHRSAGQTRKMDPTNVEMLIAKSHGISFEEQTVKRDLRPSEIGQYLNIDSLYTLLDKNKPNSTDSILDTLIGYKFCKIEGKSISITNLGAILLAKDISVFNNLSNRSVKVRLYKGVNNQDLISEQVGMYGYAVGFEGLINYIMSLLPHKEIIDDSLRKEIAIYPKIAIREFVANALVHQDFSVNGMPLTIEIFADRIVITNPGSPLNDVNRFIDLPPRSRNEELAQALYILKICERRGSGVDRAILALEEKKLPAAKISKGEDYTRVVLYGPKKLADMTKDEKILVCYQHTCLLHESNEKMTNLKLRERLGISRNNSNIATRIIQETLEEGYIRLSDPTSDSKKYASYIPFYA